MFRWYLYPVGSDNYLVVVAVALLLLALWALVPLPGKASRTQRKVLLGLRLAVILLVVLAMLRPTLVLTQSKLQSATLVILADASRSMTVRDEANGRSRWEAEKKALDDAKGALRAIGARFEIKAYRFDSEAHPADVNDGVIALNETPDGQQTAIGAVMEDVLRQEAGKRLLAMVLLSDGAQRAYPPRDALPQAAANRLKHLGYPLYTIRFGQSRGLSEAQDVAVTEFLADQRVFVKNELAVSGQIRVDGFVNREISVRLLAEDSSGKMEVVGQQTVRATTSGELIPVNFSYVPQQPGEFKLTLEAEAQAGELVTTNNRLSTFVNVLKGGLNVLYLEAFPGRPEMPHLVRSLAASPDIHVRRETINLRVSERPAEMSQWFKPGKFDVYILGDLDSTAFTKEQMTDLAEAISRGAGLIMMGGFHSFGPGGYAETPLAAVLPVKMDRLQRQPPDSTPNKDLHLPGPIKMQPSEIGRDHFSMRLGNSAPESAQAWAQLPALEGANKWTLDEIKQGAAVLATADANHPLLVSWQHGDGRVMAFAGDTTWHWWLQGFQSAHKRFWRQTVLWLAKKDESEEGNVWVKLSQRRFTPRANVGVTAGANGPTGEPVKDATFKAEIELPDRTTTPLPLIRGEQEATGSFRGAVQPGDYTIRVTAMADGKELGTSRARFLVSEQDLELDNATADATLLNNLAVTTGGKAVAPEEFPALLQQLAKQTEDLEVQTEVKQTPWDSWPFFFLLTGLLGVEWFLRKRWGMV